jgi:aspartate-semialdehyde dehydrogenase
VRRGADPPRHRLPNGLAFWVSGDNLWKGAALNAVQVAELMVREGLLKPKAALAAV